MNRSRTADTSIVNLSRKVEATLPDFEQVEALPAMLMAVRFDDTDTMKLTYLNAGGDPYKVLWDTLNEVMDSGKPFDVEAIALICSGEMAQIETVEELDETRQRVRVVSLINDLGLAVTVRRADGEVMHFDNAGEGALPELLRLWWAWWKVLPTMAT